ncbi:tetratricopeptide repeat protein [Pendulispora albinea]|uniref:Tetratricopeptide repeat protein n=1 Tax=Pendulispora albinea TaxID=2741071 RepID=A0ABZ2LR05_9BACT
MMTRLVRLALVLAAALSLGACGSASGARSAKTAAPLPEDRDPKLLYERGKAYAELGDLVRAEQYLAAALNAHGDERAVLPALFRVCIASRHYRLASEYAEVALARRPKDARLRFVAGAFYVSIGERARARDYLEEAAHQLPDDAEIQFAVAVFFRDELTDRVAADPYFREYLRLAPKGEHADEAKSSLMLRLAMATPATMTPLSEAPVMAVPTTPSTSPATLPATATPATATPATLTPATTAPEQTR